MMNKKVKVDLDLHEALRNPIYCLLMSSEEVSKEVEAIYLENEMHYKNIASKFQDNSKFFNGLQATDKWKIVMFYAVTKEMEEQDEKRYEDFIESMIKKSYKRIYDFTVRNGYNLGLFYNFITNREPNVDDITNTLYGCLHVYIAKDLPDFNLVLTPINKVFLENLHLGMQPMEIGLSVLNDEVYESSLTYYQKLTGKKWRKSEVKQVRGIIVDIENLVVKNNSKLQKVIQQTGNTRVSYATKPLSYLRHGMSVLNLLGLDNIYFFKDITISREEWALIYAGYSLGSKDKGFTAEDEGMALMYSLLMFAQTKAYKALEDNFWETNLNLDRSAVLEEKESLNEQRQIFNLEKEELIKTTERAERKVQELQNKINELEATLEKERADNELVKQSYDEKIALLPSMQKALFYSEDDLHESYKDDVDEITKFGELIKDKKVVLVGGHDKFRNKISEVFPSIFSISPDEKHIGEKQIEQADIILFVASYNNHNQFERVKSLYRNQQIVYIYQGSSIEKIVRRSLNILKKDD